MSAEKPVVKVECPTHCHAKVVEAVTQEQHKSTTEKLEKIIFNQEKIDGSVRQVALAINNFVHLQKNLDEYKIEAEKKFDVLFSLIREKAGNQELEAIKNEELKKIKENITSLQKENITKKDLVLILTIFGVAIAGLQVLIAIFRHGPP